MCYNVINRRSTMEKEEKKSVKSIIITIITILVILFAISWGYGITVTTNDDGEAECYNIYGKRVGC